MVMIVWGELGPGQRCQQANQCQSSESGAHWMPQNEDYPHDALSSQGESQEVVVWALLKIGEVAR